MNKSSYFKKKRKKKKEIFKKDLGTRGIGLILLRLLSKKKKSNSQFSIPRKNSRFQNFSQKKKKKNQSKFSIPLKNSRFPYSKIKK